MKDNTFFFDLDGTLTDSGPGIIRCVELALHTLGITGHSRESLTAFIGPPLRETFPRFGVPAEQVERAVSIFRQEYNVRGKWENTPYPGIRELLSFLKERGCRLFVATSKPENVAKELLEHFGLAKFFERICGASGDASRETKEQVIRYLLEQTDPGDHVYMVGDTDFDVLGAKALGIPTIGVTWGFGSEASMLSAGAITTVHTMEQLREVLVAL